MASTATMPTAAPAMPKKGKKSSKEATSLNEIKFRKQFFRTQMCTNFLEGNCTRGKLCLFAHSKSEIRGRPTLDKTKMCKLLEECPNQDTCLFAHNRSELVSTTEFTKTKMCHFGTKCHQFENCRYAHSLNELRKVPASIKKGAKANKEAAVEKKEQLPAPPAPRNLRELLPAQKLATPFPQMDFEDVSTRCSVPTGSQPMAAFMALHEAWASQQQQQQQQQQHVAAAAAAAHHQVHSPLHSPTGSMHVARIPITPQMVSWAQPVPANRIINSQVVSNHSMALSAFRGAVSNIWETPRECTGVESGSMSLNGDNAPLASYRAPSSTGHYAGSQVSSSYSLPMASTTGSIPMQAHRQMFITKEELDMAQPDCYED